MARGGSWRRLDGELAVNELSPASKIGHPGIIAGVIRLIRESENLADIVLVGVALEPRVEVGRGNVFGGNLPARTKRLLQRRARRIEKRGRVAGGGCRG